MTVQTAMEREGRVVVYGRCVMTHVTAVRVVGAGVRWRGKKETSCQQRRWSVVWVEGDGGGWVTIFFVGFLL